MDSSMGVSYGDRSASAAIERAKQSGNINIHNVHYTEVMDLSQNSREEQDKHAEMLRKIEAQSRARTMAVPTLPEEVASLLRKLGQPIKLFGESAADIRERLREYCAQLEMDGEGELIQSLQEQDSKKQISTSISDGGKDEVVYTIASSSLIEARRKIAAYSFKQTPKRLSYAKKRKMDHEILLAEDKYAEKLYKNVKKLAVNVSSIGDERPLSFVRISPENSIIASASWTGIGKLWSIHKLKCYGPFGAHKDRLTSLSWHPTALKLEGPALIATASVDKTACLWNVKDLVVENDPNVEHSKFTPVTTFIGHADRLEFHPCGDYIGTACYDLTWRLWDVESGTQLLLQDGHGREVHTLSFQADGSLVATGDLGGIVRLWDLRSGKTIHSMAGHVKKVTSSAFSPNCFELATGSEDHTVRIWDLRKKGCAYTVPAHSSLISDMRFGASGEVLVTSSFDCTARIWSTRDFSTLCSLKGHEGRMSSCDLTPDESTLVTCSLDRTIKVWVQKES